MSNWLAQTQNVASYILVPVMAVLICLIAFYFCSLLGSLKFRQSFFLKRTPLIFLGVILIASIFLRLNQPWEHGLFFDEDVYLSNARMIVDTGTTKSCDFGSSVSGKLVCFTGQNGFSVLQKGYPMLLAILFKFTGFSEQVAFSFNAVLGIMTIILVFYLGRELLDEMVGLFAAGFLALAPVHIRWTIATSSDVPALFFLCLSMLTFLLFLRLGIYRLLIFSLLVLSFAAFIRAEMLLALPVFILILGLDQQQGYKLLLRRTGLFLILPSVFFGFNLGSDVLSIGEISTTVKKLFEGNFLSAANFSRNVSINFFYHVSILDLLMAVLGVGFVMAIVGFEKPDLRRKLQMVVALAVVFFIFYTSLLAGAYGVGENTSTVRYTLPWLLAIIICSGLGWRLLLARFFPNYELVVFAIGMFGLFCFTFWRYGQLVPEGTNSIGAEEAFEITYENNYANCLWVVPNSSAHLFHGNSAISYGSFVNLKRAKDPLVLGNSCTVFFRSVVCDYDKESRCQELLSSGTWEVLGDAKIPAYRLK